MERIFVCTPIRPGFADAADRFAPRLRAWAAHARACTARVCGHDGAGPVPLMLVAAVHERVAAAHAALFAELDISTVAVGDDTPFPSCGDADIMCGAPTDATLRGHGGAALMRVRILAHVCTLSGATPHRSVMWFLGLESRDWGTPAHLAAAWGMSAASGVCLLPQPDVFERRCVVIDLPAASARADDTIAIMDARALLALEADWRADGGGVANATSGAASADVASADVASASAATADVDSGERGEIVVRQVRAGGVDGFGWAIAPLSVFAAVPMTVGRMPVTSLWLASDGGRPARAIAPERVGVDYGWYWSARAKNIPVVALLS